MYFNNKFAYHPIKSPTAIPDSPSSTEKQRRTKSQSLFFLVFLLLSMYIVLSVLLPERKTWFTNYSGSSYFQGSGLSSQFSIQERNNNNNVIETINISSYSQQNSARQSTALPTTPTTVDVTHVPLITRLPGTAQGQLGDKIACAIPRLDPFDKTIRHLIKFKETVNCTDKFPLLFNSTATSTIVPLTESIRAAGYGSCCYKTIHRKNYSDSGYMKSDTCYPISVENSTNIEQKQGHEFLAILCNEYKTNIRTTTTAKPTNSSSSEEEVDKHGKLVDMHVLVHLKSPVEKRIGKYYNKLKRSKAGKGGKDKSKTLLEKDRVNVVILGIDAVSHMNFLRVMPRSYSYIMNNLSAVEMQSFNKMGDNTYPNMGAALTSYNISQLENCSKNDAFDECPFIWKKYAAQGYRTSYGEDSTWMGIFNYLKRGFEKPPTDYYLRPFGEAADTLIGTHKLLNAKICMGPRLSLDVLLGYMRKLAFRMGHDRRYFQLIWATSLTHDYLNYGHLGDESLLSMLQWFQEKDYFNQTVFILMSDHGIRWGEIRDFVQGQLEERLPFLYFVLPEWFKKKYSRAYGNLLKNTDKLTTHFDVHETLNDLLDLNSINSAKLLTREMELNMAQERSELPRGISQFIPIPKARTCEMAGVEDHFCTCHDTKVLDIKHPLVEQAANFIVYSINKMISKSVECAFLGLERTKQALAIGTNFRKAYQLILQTSPGGAVFESSVEKDDKGFWKVSGAISRTNLYGNQSHCIKEKELKLYCYCLDLFIADKDLHRT